MSGTMSRYGKIALALFAIVALTVACGGEESAQVTAPETDDLGTLASAHHNNDHDGGPGGGGGDDDDGGGGKEMATFEWRLDGDVSFVALTDPDLIGQHKVRDGDTKTHVTFQDEDEFNRDKRVDVSFLFNEDVSNAEICFGDGDGTVEDSDGNLNPGSFVVEGEDQPTMFSQIVFNGWNQDGTEKIRYILEMDGLLADGPWLPEVGDPDGSTVDLTNWELSTQNRFKNKNPCVGSGSFTFTVNITRTK